MRPRVSKYAAIAIMAGLSFCPPSRLDAQGTEVRRKPSKSTLYEKGLKLYADGNLPQAMAAFEGVLRKDPGNPYASAAIRHIKLDLSEKSRPQAVQAPPWSAPPSAAAEKGAERFSFESASEAVDEFLWRTVPGALNFERTLGDAEASLGTLKALHGRVAQLLAERKRARAKGLRFRKQKELLALTRRMPSIMAV